MTAPTPRLCDRPLRPPVVVADSTSLADVARRMRDENVSSVLVGERGQLAAILTERDLVDAFARNIGPDAPAELIAVRDPITVAPDESVQDAALLMLRNRVRHLVVAVDRQAVAIVSMREALDRLVEAASTQVVYAVLRQAVSGPSENWLG